jgi:hypothetical protein
MGLLTPRVGGKRLEVGELAVGRSTRRPDVSERVPALGQDQRSPPVVSQADVPGAAGIRRPGRKLERTGVVASPAEPENQVLDLQVRGVRDILDGITRRFEAKVPVHGCEGPLPDVHRQAAAPAALHQADRRLRDTDRFGELLLRHPPPQAGATKLTSEAGHGFLVAPRRLGHQARSPAPRHIAAMIAGSAYATITCADPQVRRA